MNKRPHRQHYTQRHEDYSKVPGLKVVVGDGDRAFEKALRLFSKKVQASGLIRELRDREAYEKPSVTRKRARAIAVNRARRQQEDINQMTLRKGLRKPPRKAKKDDKRSQRSRDSYEG